VSGFDWNECPASERNGVRNHWNTQLSVRLPATTVQRIRELADARNTSQSNIITMAVEALDNSATARPDINDRLDGAETRELADAPVEVAQDEQGSFTEQDIERIIEKEHGGAPRKVKRKMRRAMLKKLRKTTGNEE
jgi:predicted transcriptional regulator